MNEKIVEFVPTSSATTRETEPEVVAGISSGDLTPDQPLDINVGDSAGYGRSLLLLATGLAIGFGLARWLGRSG